MKMLLFIYFAACFAAAYGLDPQPTRNVWQSANSSRPWQNPEWSSSGGGSLVTVKTPVPVSDAEWPSLAGARKPTQQTQLPSPNTSYSNVVSPSNQRPETAVTTPRPPRHNNQKGSQDSVRRGQYNNQRRPQSALNATRTTDNELTSLSEKLFDDDVSNTGSNIRLNYQSRTQSNSLVDVAPQPLLTVDAEVFKKPTVKALRQLYDNYIADSSFVESVTSTERQEESEFLDKVLETTVMKEAMEFLSDKGYVQRNTKAQKDLLNLIWFTAYSRGGGIIGSSAFEHVFLGELKKDEVAGLHNWIYFAHEEVNNKADYMGYLKKLDLGKKSNLLKIHYRWSNVIKHSGSMFVGTSPELEMALYTICFLTRPDDRCPLSLGGKTFGIQTYTYRLRGNKGNVIGTAYPMF